MRTQSLLLRLTLLAMGLSLAAPFPARAAVPAGAAALEDALTQVTAKVMPVVVNVVSTISATAANEEARKQFEDWFKRSPFGDRFPFPFGTPPRRGPAESLGTGLIVRADGYVLTNRHVVENADKVKVIFAADADDPDEYVAQVVGTDKESDLAVLKIEKTGLPVATFADSRDVKIGSFAIAIGSPFRFHQSVSLGIVSAKGRHLTEDGYRGFQDYIQTDASINQGNSGGPLVNLAGEVIGINTWIYSPTGGNVGLGFAVPSNTITQILPLLIEGKKIRRGFLGIAFTAVGHELADFYGIEGGFQVSEVTPDGPAAKAKVEVGDIILAVDGKKPSNSEEFRRLIGGYGPGEKVELTIFRRGQEIKETVTLGERPNGEDEEPVAVNSQTLLGLSLRPLTDDEREQLKLPEGTKGLLITDVAPDSDAENADPQVRAGTVLVAVEEAGGRQTKIESLADLKRLLAKFKPGDRLVLVVELPEGQQHRHLVTVTDHKDHPQP